MVNNSKDASDFGVYGKITQTCVSGIDSFLIIYVLSFFFK